MANIFEIENLEKSFGENEVLKGINFTVQKGEVVSIIGSSGSGKSTLLRCINLLEEPDSGEIRYHGENMLEEKSSINNYRTKVGMVFQSFNLFNNMTVLENCVIGQVKVLKRSREEAVRIADKFLEKVGMYPFRDARPTSLSGGQKQRVAIARAIATNPSILLSDEGTSALDPANTKSVLSLLKKIVDEFDMTVIMITHQMEVAKEICDRIAVMEAGKIIEENNTKELFTNPKTAVTRSFIKNLEDDVEEGYVRASDYKGDVLRLSYADNNYDKPILSQCVKKFDIDFSILSGNINKLNAANVGYLTVQILGKDEERARAIEFLKENSVIVEVL